MYRLEDRWQDYIDDCWAFAQIETGPRLEATCKEVQTARLFGDVSISEALIEADHTSLVLLRWLAANKLDALDHGARLRLLGVIGRLDPPAAATLYVWHAGLTDEEDELLKSAFMPSMALMRRKVQNGTCPRAKV